MTRRIYCSILPGLFLLAGCQSASNMMPSWLASNDHMYSADELTAMNNPVPAASQSPSSNAIQQVSSVAQTTAPAAAAKVEQLIQAGRTAISESGDANPGKLQQARSLFEEAIALDGTSGSAHHGLAIVADRQQDWQTAELHYKQALSQKPQDASLLNDLGYSYVLQNRFYEASQYLNQALQISPQLELAHINLALLSLKQGDRNSATTQLSGIFSPVEVQNTLAQLDSDVQKQTISTQNAMMAQNSPLPPGATGQWPRTGVNPGVPVQQVSSPVQAASPQDARPIHVYPPGIAVDMAGQQPASVTQNQQPFAPGQQQPYYAAPRNNVQQFSNANYPGIVPNVQPAAQGMRQLPYNAQPNQNFAQATPPSGVPVGGVLAPQQQPDYNPGPAIEAGRVPPPQSGVSRGAQNAPVMGLNAGPGSLFPIPAQQGNSAVGAQQPNYQLAPAQTTPQQGYGTQPPVNNYPPQAAAAGQYLNQQSNVNPQYGYPGQSQVQGYPANYAAPGSQVQSFNNGQAQYPNVAMQNPAIPMQPTAGLPANSGGVMSISTANPQVPAQTASLPNPAMANAHINQAARANSQTRPSTSPLAAYERQLQSIDSQYNQAVQQMDGRATQMPNGMNR